MRVISGKYKGSILQGDALEGTRPTLARIKESLFATIQDKVENSLVLDLFAGSGALGIEALSMGAKKAYFVEKQNKTYEVLNNNIKRLKIENISHTYKMDYTKFLKNINLKFDLVFLDPPYNSTYLNESINLLLENNLLNNDSLIICETDNLSKIAKNSCLEEVKSKKYGDKYIVILKKI